MYLQNPAKTAENIVVGTDFSYPCAAIYVGTGGDITVKMDGTGTVVFYNVPDGGILPVRAKQVTAVAGGASNLIALIN